MAISSVFSKRTTYVVTVTLILLLAGSVGSLGHVLERRAHQLLEVGDIEEDERTPPSVSVSGSKIRGKHRREAAANEARGNTTKAAISDQHVLVDSSQVLVAEGRSSYSASGSNKTEHRRHKTEHSFKRSSKGKEAKEDTEALNRDLSNEELDESAEEGREEREVNLEELKLALRDELKEAATASLDDTATGKWEGRDLLLGLATSGLVMGGLFNVKYGFADSILFKVLPHAEKGHQSRGMSAVMARRVYGVIVTLAIGATLLAVEYTVLASSMHSYQLAAASQQQQHSTRLHALLDRVMRTEGLVRRARERKAQAEHKAHTAMRRAEQAQANLAALTATHEASAQEAALDSFHPSEADRANCPALLAQYDALVKHQQHEGGGMVRSTEAQLKEDKVKIVEAKLAQCEEERRQCELREQRIASVSPAPTPPAPTAGTTITPRPQHSSRSHSSRSQQQAGKVTVDTEKKLTPIQNQGGALLDLEKKWEGFNPKLGSLSTGSLLSTLKLDQSFNNLDLNLNSSFSLPLMAPLSEEATRGTGGVPTNLPHQHTASHYHSSHRRHSVDKRRLPAVAAPSLPDIDVLKMAASLPEGQREAVMDVINDVE